MSRASLNCALLLTASLVAAPTFAQGLPHAQPSGQPQPRSSGFGQPSATGQPEGEPQASPDESYRFSQPIPVNIRKSNNAVLQAMLVGIDLTNITIMTPQGRTLEFSNKTVRSVRSLDGSFFYNPAKDDAAATIKKLNQFAPANGATTAGQPGVSPGTTAGTTAGSTVPFTVAGNGAGQAAGGTTSGSSAHMPAHGQTGGSTVPFSTTPAANSHTAYTPPTTTTPSTSHSPSGSHSGMPSGSHAYAPPTSANSGMPSSSSHFPPVNPGPAIPSAGMPGGMPEGMGPQTTLIEYQCSKCKHKITSATEIKAGHKCSNCGVVWGQVQDENGRITSSSPGARAGGAVSLIIVVVGVIAAIVRKVQSA